jgi:hypothetical protein
MQRTSFLHNTTVQSLFQNLAAAIRTLRRGFQNVIRHARIGAGDAVEDVIEGNLSGFRIAVLTGFDQLLGFAERRGIDEHDDLLFGRGIEEVARHGADSIIAVVPGGTRQLIRGKTCRLK